MTNWALLLCITIITNVGANYFMKLTATMTGELHEKLFTWQFFGIVMCFVIGFVSYMQALRTTPLFIASATISVQYALVIVMSWFVFNEKISPLQLFGIALILIGMIIVAYFQS